jgi:hypothetical protein
MSRKKNNNPRPAPEGTSGDESVFEYKGPVYNRPLGRGISLRAPGFAERDACLEEVMPEGDFEMEIRVWRKDL